MFFKFERLALTAFLFSLFIAVGCNDQSSGTEQVARKYCSSCHLFPEPSQLNKYVWEKDILPAMAPKLGIRYFLDSPYEASKYLQHVGSNTTGTDDIISIADWKKIISFYKTNAPATDLPQDRTAIQKFTGQFMVKEVYSNETPTISYIKIDEGNKFIYEANAADSSLYIYNDKLQLVSEYNLHNVMVDMHCFQSDKTPGARTGILTNIGIMNPNDLSTGSVDSFTITKDGTVTGVKELLNKMPRPVQTTQIDLDHDGKEDFLVCGFGNKSGALYWMKNQGGNQYQQNFIRGLPGAVKTYIDDYNQDGLPDVIALMAQAQEGIYLFTNRGNGTFDNKTLLQFPAVYGSSYFELVDFNNDGYKDILYTSGDNADYSYSSLKNYHGVYIFLNDGKFNFKQQYFFPIHGCYKAIAKDFDKDGDLDIAAISFFPDSKNQPQESFVYLENKGNSYFGNQFQFEPSAIKQFNAGKWLTMDAGDLDNDGDEDIVLGNFTPPTKEINTAQQEAKKLSFLYLENNAIPTKH